MCKEVSDKDFEELKNNVGKLTTNIAVMDNNITRQSKVMDKLVANFERLAIFIEKTNENNKKISILFKKYDEVSANCTEGDKNCSVNTNNIKNLQKKVDKIDKFAVGFLIAIAVEFIAVIVFLVEKHLS